MANKKDVLIVPFPYDDPERQRVETGPVQFGDDDWPGMFVRGDDAFLLSVVIEDLVSRSEERGLVDQINNSTLRGWAKTLRSSHMREPNTPPPLYLDKLADMLFKDVPEDTLVWKSSNVTYTAKEIRQMIANRETFGYEFIDALLNLALRLLQNKANKQDFPSQADALSSNMK
jgi:hypothetical protein